jgi:hypothetical protein
MNYTVLWLPDAEQELAALWLAAPDRKVVTQAANEIDQRLRRNAPNEGESRPDGLRILLVAPLGVLFGVEESRRIVQVVQVWCFE